MSDKRIWDNQLEVYWLYQFSDDSQELKRNDFNLDLNDIKLGADFILSSRVFQNLGPTEVNIEWVKMVLVNGK